MFDLSDNAGRFQPKSIRRRHHIATAIRALGHNASAVAHGLEQARYQALHILPIELVNAILNELNTIVIGRCEESVARAVMIETGFAPDWLQYELTDPFDSAKPIRTDFAWERQARELTLGELDGLIKYTDQTMLAGRTTAEALVAERQREAHLSLYGHPLLRFTINEVRSAGMLAKKLQTAGIRQTALPTWLNEVEL